jgi:16S rRNA U1498 N3-methylase RsmE
MNLILFEPGEPEKEREGTLSLKDKRAVHLVKVLHKKEGDHFDAGILEGPLGTGTITGISSGVMRFVLSLNRAPPPRTPIHLAVGFPRPIQLRRLLRDCASLGLAAVDLAGTELGEKSYRDTKLLYTDGGARASLIEGAVQSRDTRIPALALYPTIAAWLAAKPWQDGAQEGRPPADAGTAPLLAAADNVEPGGTFSGLGPLKVPGQGPCAVLAVGAERGWSSRERKQLEAAGFLRLSMGSRALRTETACTAAAILLMEKMGLLD